MWAAEQLDRLGEPLELLLGRPEARREIRSASMRGRSRRIANARAPQLVDRAAAGQPAIRNVTSVAIALARRDQRHARDRGQPVGRPRASRRAPARGPTAARRTSTASRSSARARRPTAGGSPSPRTGGRRDGARVLDVERLVREERGVGRHDAVGDVRRAHRAPMPSGPSSHFWPGIAYASTPRSSTTTGIAPAACAPSTIDDRARARGPARRSARPAGRRPSSTGTWLTTIARAGSLEGRRERRDGLLVVAAVARRRRSSTSTPSRSRRASSGPRPPGCSWRVVRTRSPGPPGERR